MAGTILLVITEGFNDMAFLSCQVILEEQGNDVIITSKKNGTSKGGDTSVITVSLSEALDQNEEYAGLIIVGSNDLSGWDTLESTLKSFYLDNKVIGIIGNAVDLLPKVGITYNKSGGLPFIVENNLLIMLEPDESEAFAEKLALMIT